MAASLRAGLVTPDVAAHVREARAVAQLRNVPRRLVRLVGTRDPLELVRTNDVIGHLRSLGPAGRRPIAWCARLARTHFAARANYRVFSGRLLKPIGLTHA